ncbi:MAG: PspC domain-containing protein [Acidibacter sp.]|jgi:phage shock protein PspC (stress-responsive transcriptional regulator)|nr:PspC domain-containing protein [Acidibacter sp.]
MKRISITVSLNRSTVQMDEASFVRLENYLAEASRTLAMNPDRHEILADLEQAIADRCLQRLPAGQALISLIELEAVLTEVGEVRDAASESNEPKAEYIPRDTQSPRKRVEQLNEGAILSGICAGIARYVEIDVIWVRIVMVIMTVLSGFTAVLIYALLMFLLPIAPIRAGSPPLGKVPAKFREATAYVRSFFEPAKT